MDSTNTPVALPANQPATTAPFEERANDEIAWARQRIVARATELRDQMARLIERLADPTDHPAPSDGVINEAVALDRLIHEYRSNCALLRTLGAVRRATEASASGSTTAR